MDRPVNRLIAVFGCEPGAGRKTISRELARQWGDTGKAVMSLVIASAKDAAVQSCRAEKLEDWVPRFKSLSPIMLRHYLSAEGEDAAKLELPAYPPIAAFRDLLGLLHAAFDWTLVSAPAAFSPEGTALLDQADLYLWIAKPGPGTSAFFKSIQEELTALHFPYSLAQAVINRLPLKIWAAEGLPEILPGKTAIGKIPEDGALRFREGVQALARTLESGEDFFRQAAALPSGEHVIEELKSRVQPELLRVLEQEGSVTSSEDAERAQKTVEACLAQDATLPASREERGDILTRVLHEVLGLGPLEPLLKDPAVSEVMVNGRDCVYVEKKGKLHATDVKFSSDKQLRTVIDRIVSPIGRRVDESMPLCDARLADGSRVNIVLPPLALEGPIVTIRKFMSKTLSLDELASLGSMSGAMADFLRLCVIGRKNIVVAGGTGSGKTTLLNALSSVIPEDERIVTIEDAAELRLQKPHVVRLESRPANAEGCGAIPIRRLVINALRMRPDRIVVGECRGGEALDMLQAMNTGHDGSLTTVHANSPRDALGRLETLVLMAGMDLPVKVVREQIRSAVHLIVQQARLSDGSRKVISITEVTGMEGDTLTTQELYRHRGTGFESTGLMPRFGALGPA